MKEKHGCLWVETNEDGTVNIGLTRDYIKQKLSDCFHIIQADSFAMVKNEPMFVVETIDDLECIDAPIDGKIMKFNTKAQDFPDKLTEEDVIIQLCPPGVKMSQPKYQSLINDFLADHDGVVPGDNLNLYNLALGNI